MLADDFDHFVYQCVIRCGVVGQFYVDEEMFCDALEDFGEGGDFLPFSGIQLFEGTLAQIGDVSSALSFTSNSMASAPSFCAISKARRVFSGAWAEAPRWAKMTGEGSLFSMALRENLLPKMTAGRVR